MPVSDLRGKRCFITGAASGIGRATAVAAAREGAELVLTDIQAEALETAADEIRAAGGTVLFTKAADISDHDAVKALADEVHAAHGSMDVVMNVAGISTWGPIHELEHEHWERLIAVNLMGPIHVIETFLPPMVAARRGGHLVNVSSAAGIFGFPWHAAYSATKFGLRGISEVARADLHRYGIGVSLVCPGGVDTGLVGTVKIVGVDRDNPKVASEIKRFQRHAKSPEHAAEAILNGVKRNRFWVYTSNDIRVGHFFARRFDRGHAMVMRIAAAQFNRRLRPRA